MKAYDLERLARHFQPKTPDGWSFTVDALIHDREDAYILRGHRFRSGTYGLALDRTHRVASRTLYPSRAMSDADMCATLKEAVFSLARELFPPPLPNFRIGTKPHAKRLQPRNT